MTEARNIYPRLCWGCLAIIESYDFDYANLNDGGVCASCRSTHAGELPYLREALQGYTGRMNNVLERDELLMQLDLMKVG